MKAYLANGLFGLGDRILNELIANELREAFKSNNIELDLYVPQENAEINDKQAYADSVMIADGDDKYLNECDFVIAVIDGVEIDSGVACEIGVATTLGKKVFGLLTDTRQQGTDNKKKIEALIKNPTENQFIYRNLYVIGKLNKSGGVYSTIGDIKEAALKFAKE